MTERTVDILAVGAHPDDVEIGAGATLAQEAALGRRVLMVDATAGEAATNGTPQERAAEAWAAARVLGVCGRTGFGLPDGRLDAVQETLAGHLEALLVRTRPRLLLLPHPDDRHADHRALGEIGGRWAGPGLWVAYYLIHSPVLPTHFVGVDRGYAAKEQALWCHRSQFVHTTDRKPTPLNQGFLERIREREEGFGQRLGVAVAEGFVLVGPDSRDPVTGIDPRKDGGVFLSLMSQVVET